MDDMDLPAKSVFAGAALSETRLLNAYAGNASVGLVVDCNHPIADPGSF